MTRTILGYHRAPLGESHIARPAHVLRVRPRLGQPPQTLEPGISAVEAADGGMSPVPSAIRGVPRRHRRVGPSGVGPQRPGVSLPGIDDVSGRLARRPAVDDADERPVAADVPIGERLDPFGATTTILRRCRTEGFEALHDRPRLGGPGVDSGARGRSGKLADKLAHVEPVTGRPITMTLAR